MLLALLLLLSLLLLLLLSSVVCLMLMALLVLLVLPSSLLPLLLIYVAAVFIVTHPVAHGLHDGLTSDGDIYQVSFYVCYHACYALLCVPPSPCYVPRIFQPGGEASSTAPSVHYTPGPPAAAAGGISEKVHASGAGDYAAPQVNWLGFDLVGLVCLVWSGFGFLVRFGLIFFLSLPCLV